MDPEIQKIRTAEYISAGGVKQCFELLTNLINQWSQGEIDDKKFVVDYIDQVKANLLWMEERKNVFVELARLAMFELIDETVPKDPNVIPPQIPAGGK